MDTCREEAGEEQCRRSPARSLRAQPINNPAPARTAIAQAIVQAVGTPLPEFDLLRRNAVAAPVVRRGYVVREAGRDFRQLPLQDGAVRNHPALFGGPRP